MTGRHHPLSLLMERSVSVNSRPQVLQVREGSASLAPEDQYLNDLGDSPAKICPPDIKHTRSAPNSFIGLFHTTTRLPHDTAFVTREDAEDSFFGVSRSLRLVSEFTSQQLTDVYATNCSHSLDGSFDLSPRISCGLYRVPLRKTVYPSTVFLL
jgi:hypothetical protein